MSYNRTTIVNTKEAVLEYLEGLDNEDLVAVHNQYCEEENYPDDRIESNDDNFFEGNFSGDILAAVRAVSFGDYNYSHSYIKFNGYANLETTNDPSEWIDIPSIANSILESPEVYDIELEDKEVEEETTED